MRFLNSKLKIENTILQNIAKKYGTPAYCYSYKQLRENINDFKKNFKSISPLICFAIKSNTNLNLIKEIKKFGLGADVVSMGELILALKAGISPRKIVFSGVGKTSREINFAIDKNILLINSESKSEIIEIDKIARIKKKQVNIGIRLNPNTDAKTLSQISTGKKDNKFGVNDKKLNYKKYHSAIKKFLKNKKSQIIFEPGRSIIGNTGVLISKVIYIKESYKKNFVILDAAMNDLMRPALYGAVHRILPLLKRGKKSKKIYEFVGPICESTDKFTSIKNFQELKEKDFIAICDVGAYGISLSSNYNLRPKPIEILINGSKIRVVKKRQKHHEII